MVGRCGQRRAFPEVGQSISKGRAKRQMDVSNLSPAAQSTMKVATATDFCKELHAKMRTFSGLRIPPPCWPWLWAARLPQFCFTPFLEITARQMICHRLANNAHSRCLRPPLDNSAKACGKRSAVASLFKVTDSLSFNHTSPIAHHGSNLLRWPQSAATSNN
jgi:hypothetical protein